MNQKVVKQLVTPDRSVAGVRMFNPSKPHGTVYADGFFEAKYVQEYNGTEVYYRGDHTPIGADPGKVVPHADLARENASLKESNEALLARLEALEKQLAPNEGAAGVRSKK